jgi:hypothetical protein
VADRIREISCLVDLARDPSQSWLPSASVQDMQSQHEIAMRAGREPVLPRWRDPDHVSLCHELSGIVRSLYDISTKGGEQGQSSSVWGNLRQQTIMNLG